MASFQVFRDDFQRSNATRWGSSPAPILRTWAATTGQSVDGEYGILSPIASAANPETSVDLTGLHLATDGEIILTASFSATATSVMGYAYLQLTNEGSTHNIALIVGYDSTAYPYSLRIYNYGISANYVSNSGSGLSTATVYNVKWDISRTRGTQRARIWAATASEPGTWGVETDLEADFFFTTLLAGGLLEDDDTSNNGGGITCTLAALDDFTRTVNPGFGTATSGDVWSAPVYSLSTTACTALAHVVGGVGQLDLTATATEPNLSHHANASVSLPGVLDNLNEYRLSGTATLVHNFPALSVDNTKVGSADLVWVLTVADDPNTGSYGTQISVELTKVRLTSGDPVTFVFHLTMTDNGFSVADVLTAEEFVTALTFDWAIDRSASRGDIQMTMSHVNGGVAYTRAISAGPAPVAPVNITVEADSNLQNHVTVDWSPSANNDNWMACDA